MICIVIQLFRVLLRLLKHNCLLSFNTEFLNCVKVLNEYRKDMIPKMVIFIVKLLLLINLDTKVLLCTMMELYKLCNQDKRISLQLQIVGQLSKLFSNDDLQISIEAMNFWNLFLHENATMWKSKPDYLRIIIDGLKKVIGTYFMIILPNYNIDTSY